MSNLNIVVFALNNEFCGVESKQVQEIVKFQELEKVARMPKFISGIVKIRGNSIPVISLNSRFEIGQTSITKKTKIIITKVDENPVGFLVNDVIEILPFSDKEIESPPEIILKTGNNHLVGVGKSKDRLVSILDFNKLLTSVEIKKVQKFKAN